MEARSHVSTTSFAGTGLVNGAVFGPELGGYGIDFDGTALLPSVSRMLENLWARLSVA